MDIHIDIEQVKMFAAIAIAGSVYGHYLYTKGLKKGWDDLAYSLLEENIIDIDDETGEIKRSTNRY